jgi:hypothetical protein
MMTTTATETLAEVSRRVLQHQNEVARLKSRRVRAVADLEALQPEQREIAKGVASGTMDGARALEISQRLIAEQANVDGLASLVAAEQKHYDAAQKNLTVLQLEQRGVEEAAAVETLGREARERIGSVAKIIAHSLEADLTRVLAIRRELVAVSDREFERAGHRASTISPLAAQTRSALKALDTELRRTLEPMTKLLANR